MPDNNKETNKNQFDQISREIHDLAHKLSDYIEKNKDTLSETLAKELKDITSTIHDKVVSSFPTEASRTIDKAKAYIVGNSIGLKCMMESQLRCHPWRTIGIFAGIAYLFTCGCRGSRTNCRRK